MINDQFSNEINVPGSRDVFGPSNEYMLHSRFQIIPSSIEKLEILHERKHNKFYLLIIKIISSVSRPISHLFKFSQRTIEAGRTQEHLMRMGSKAEFQKEAFLNALGDRSGGRYDQLRCEIERMPINSGKNATGLCKEIEKTLVSLKDGESTWIYAGTVKGSHGMMMRLTKIVTDDGISYDMHFSNTGAGLIENPEFHPTVPNGAKNKKKFQTVALIKNIPESKFKEINFFERFMCVANTGEDPNFEDNLTQNDTVENLGEYGENLNIINKMYKVINDLGLKPETLVNQPDASSYFSRAQIGGSCVPSSMWAMAKVILSKEELDELKLDMRFQSLLHNYARIKSGWDQGDTAKILALDQIQKLNGMYKTYGVEVPLVISNIEKELMLELGMERTEVKIAGNSKNIDAFLTKKSENNYDLKPMGVSLNANEESLVADSIFKEVENGMNYNVQYSDDHVKGLDVLDETYLLYYSVATGNQRASNIHLGELMHGINADSANRKNELSGIDSQIASLSKKNLELMLDKSNEIENKEKIAANVLAMKELRAKRSELVKIPKAIQTAELLLKLSVQLAEIDHTRSGIAKGTVLLELAAHVLMQACEKKTLDAISRVSIDTHPSLKDLAKQVNLHLSAARNDYANLNVEFYVGDENIWVNAHHQMIKLRPS